MGNTGMKEMKGMDMGKPGEHQEHGEQKH